MEQLIFWVLIGYLSLMGLFMIFYLPRLRCYFGAFKKQKHLYNPTTNHFAVLVPARNESKIITGILDCLKKQDYPSDKMDVYVIVKEKDDPTIQIVKKYGFNSYVAATQHRKSEALDLCLKHLKKENKVYDAYMVIDADCWLDADCIREANNALASNRDIITCKKRVKNYYLSNKKAGPLSALCNGTIWTLIDELGNQYKSEKGLALMTITTGIVFTKKVIDRLGGFPFHQTMTEDMELMFASPLYGFTSYYCSYAHIYMDEADSIKMTQTRRNRWINGYVNSKRIYEPLLRKEMKTHKEKLENYYLIGMYYPFWFYGISVLFMFFSFVVSGALFVMKNPLWLNAMINMFIGFGFIYGSLFIMTLFVLLADHSIRCSIFRKLAILFVNPLSYMMYFKVALKALLGNEAQQWDPIERNASVERKQEL
jgi:cellulose synthase/poly-beta-1,6-N-acetylglucosamine synthase-like glycosyltransferase